ncbi:chemotaxis protein CheD [Magnetospirillum sulfuroxidans]|uniref:Probable chemoreceptor glutamine deamidase CheD n=1 Tax=Magnetospirillum sulfuroxidans TaxID=611300 RepID=A0ABS5IDX0_9PROT|nr:chemotaxis protein CheD [Magnetospirillum sulfuroxidans]
MTTILGSCVSVCLFDPIQAIGGMNHYIFPDNPDTKTATLRHGPFAIETLLDEMMRLGVVPFNLRAKVFGGGGTLTSLDCGIQVGRRNVNVALEELKRQKIQISSKRVLGSSGVMIKMLTSTGDVWLRKIKNELDHPASADHR